MCRKLNFDKHRYFKQFGCTPRQGVCLKGDSLNHSDLKGRQKNHYIMLRFSLYSINTEFITKIIWDTYQIKTVWAVKYKSFLRIRDEL